MNTLDSRVRLAAFKWLAEQVQMRGDVLQRELLVQGFTFEGQRVPLLAPNGIFKPKILPQVPLSIATTKSGPYHDFTDDQGVLHYSYRGTDPTHRQNIGLQVAARDQVPLIWLRAVVPGRYFAFWPVYVLDTDSSQLVARVDLSRCQTVVESLQDTLEELSAVDSPIQRKYTQRLVTQRLHQRKFSEQVIRAYHVQCACCRLKHRELLDGAHIIPDSDPESEQKVSNGLSLCKLHHAAFDKQVIGISPDYIIRVRPDILKEKDGPMLLHGLQGMDNTKLTIPAERSQRPDKLLLERRFEEFRKTG